LINSNPNKDTCTASLAAMTMLGVKTLERKVRDASWSTVKIVVNKM